LRKCGTSCTVFAGRPPLPFFYSICCDLYLNTLLVRYLAAGLAGILALLELLVTLFVRLKVGPQGEGFGAERTGNGSLVARALHVLVGRHFALGHPAQVAPVLRELIWQSAVTKIFIEKLCSIIAWIILDHFVPFS
jgi:hypothetical protein